MNAAALVGLSLQLLTQLQTYQLAIAKAQAEALANSKSTPTSPKWAEVEAAQIIPDALVKIAQGGDVKAIAEELDTAIEAILNK